MKLNISFIGAGNLATQLAKEFDRQGHIIQQVISTKESTAYSLAKQFGAYYADTMNKFQYGSDLAVVAVPDNQIEAVAKSLKASDMLVVHCSGSTALNALKSQRYYGVFYPLQTFSKSRKADWLNIPILTEASDLKQLKLLNSLADSMSNTVVEVSSDDRQLIHLAAVWANNFSNHMYRMAEKCLSGPQLKFALLHSLIRETAEKAIALGPGNAQTGPAIRGDEKSMQRHLDLLKDPGSKELYRIISQAITVSEKE